MQPRKYFLLFSVLGVFIVIASSIWLATAQQVNAQCGSSASSCKNCHEVQGKKPVNNDGNSWHQSHAFGDFCYICHGGNHQSTNEAEAHTGMVPPLSDTKASCLQCHTNDLDQRAQVYAKALGIDLNSNPTDANSAPKPAPAAIQTDKSAPAAAAPVVAVAAKLDVNDPNLVDYVKSYDEVVLGKKATNWGNIVLLLIIAIVGVGGGSFIILREKLVSLTFGDTKKVEVEYPSEVVDLLPAITKLKSSARKSLKSILDHPEKSEKVLSLIDEVVSSDKSEEQA